MTDKKLPNTATKIIPMLKGVDGAFSKEFTKLVNMVRTTGKKGSITLKINVRPRDNGNDEYMAMTHEIKTSLPAITSETTYAHSDDENELHQQLEVSFANTGADETPIQHIAGQTDLDEVHHVDDGEFKPEIIDP